MTGFAFDRYLRYDELSAMLQSLAAAHPGLARLEPLGSSYEGRQIWLMVLGNFGAGDPHHRPALWVDANIHSAELVASMAALRLIQDLLDGYGRDADITRALDTRTFYICPRVNPDGAEWALADVPRVVRSSIRDWPPRHGEVPGLEPRDMDGDGRILSMRIADPNGPWKICEREPRLLVRREPTEQGGQYYRLMPEGIIHDFDGVTLHQQPRRQGLDLNRNFPVEWRGEHEQAGAGPYPVSEPEVQAIVDFIARHDNICSAIALHSYSGLLLRPFSHRPDEQMPAEDLWVYETLGRKGTELTGYPAVSAYHEFRYHPREVITGAMDDWAYGELGRFAWTVELWSPLRQAGIAEGRYVDWYRDHPLEDDLRLLQWCDRVRPGQACVDWYPFDHPQLGPVELGGWDTLFNFWNPPPELLAQEIAGVSHWLLWHNLVSPALSWHSVHVQPLGDDLWRVSAAVQNTGWLPTDVTRQARQKGLCRGVSLELIVGDNAELMSGAARVDGGQLEGWSHKPVTPSIWSIRDGDPTDDRLLATWVVRAAPGTSVLVRAAHERAGRIECAVTMEVC